MRYLGIDYGGKRIGIALSDPDGKIAFPREVLPNDALALEKIRSIVADERIEKIVMGDTRSHGGAENPVSAEADDFARRLGTECAMPIERAWEAWSSIEASRFAPEGSAHDDAAAAAVILQRFLDMKASSVQ